MRGVLLRFSLLWCCLGFSRPIFSTKLKFKFGRNNTGRCISALFDEYYLNLRRIELDKTVIQDNEILGMELCLSIAYLFGETFLNDYSKKTCTFSSRTEEIMTRRRIVVSMKLVECMCKGTLFLRPFYLRENNDISLYFVFKRDNREILMNRKGKYLILNSVLSSSKRILYLGYVPLESQESKLVNKNEQKPSDGQLLKPDEKSELGNENNKEFSDDPIFEY